MSKDTIIEIIKRILTALGILKDTDLKSVVETEVKEEVQETVESSIYGLRIKAYNQIDSYRDTAKNYLNKELRQTITEYVKLVVNKNIAVPDWLARIDPDASNKIANLVSVQTSSLVDKIVESLSSTLDSVAEPCKSYVDKATSKEAIDIVLEIAFAQIEQIMKDADKLFEKTK